MIVDGDIASPDVAARVIDAAEQFGGVDLLVNNAGVFIPKPFAQYTTDDLAALIATNVTGFFHVTQQAVRRMLPRKSGHVVTISTSLADQPITGVTAALPILTKGGLNAATKALAIEHAPLGIRFNAVAPGMIDTPMHKPESHGFLKQMHPIARLGTTSRDRRCGDVSGPRVVRVGRSAARGRRRACRQVVSGRRRCGCGSSGWSCPSHRGRWAATRRRCRPARCWC